VKRLSEQTLARRRTLFWLVAWISTLAGGATACALVTEAEFLRERHFLPVVLKKF
jgi:hypothetical protein